MEAKPLRLAGDPNLLLDLAGSNEDVFDAAAVIGQRNETSRVWVTAKEHSSITKAARLQSAVFFDMGIVERG
jgi:hypothetical protein